MSKHDVIIDDYGVVYSLDGKTLLGTCDDFNAVTYATQGKVTKIADWAFAERTCLQGVIIVGDNVVSIGEGAFSGCTNLEYIRIPENLKYIGDCAFEGCNKLSEKMVPLLPSESTEEEDENDYNNQREVRDWYVDEEEHYDEYNGSYAQDVMGFSDELIDEVFDGDPEAYWNID